VRGGKGEGASEDEGKIGGEGEGGGEGERGGEGGEGDACVTRSSLRTISENSLKPMLPEPSWSICLKMLKKPRAAGSTIILGIWRFIFSERSRTVSSSAAGTLVNRSGVHACISAWNLATVAVRDTREAETDIFFTITTFFPRSFSLLRPPILPRPPFDPKSDDAAAASGAAPAAGAAVASTASSPAVGTGAAAVGVAAAASGAAAAAAGAASAGSAPAVEVAGKAVGASLLGVATSAATVGSSVTGAAGLSAAAGAPSTGVIPARLLKNGFIGGIKGQRTQSFYREREGERNSGRMGVNQRT